MKKYIKASLSVGEIEEIGYDVFNEIMRHNSEKVANHDADDEIFKIVVEMNPLISDEDIDKIIEEVYYDVDSYYDMGGFGATAARIYGDEIYDMFKGQTISKRIGESNQPGGLEYCANKLGIGKFKLLEALEGMCRDGRAREISDSEYMVGYPGENL